MSSTTTSTGTTPSPTSSLKSFTPLNNSVYLHRPPPSSQNRDDGTPNLDPDLILIHGWMGASPAHISKYTTPYMTLFPCTPIIAVTTSLADAVFTSTAQNLRRIAPVLEFLESLHSDFQGGDESRGEGGPRVLLHSFSNGGAYTTSLLLTSWRQRTNKSLNVTALILDSAPGRTTMGRAINAMVVSLPKGRFIRFLGTWFLRVVYVIFGIGYWISRRTDFVELSHRALLDTGLIPLYPPHSQSQAVVDAKKGRRVYVYSKEDEMVDWRDVEAHADEAEAKGWVVQREMFVGSAHAAHVRVDRGRYWDVVEKVWSGR